MARIIGIDFGTTNTSVAIMQDGEPIIIPNKEGYRVTSSVISLSNDGRLLVGQAAKRNAIINPDNTIMSIKRVLGSDEKIRFNNILYDPEEIVAMILIKIKNDVEEYLGESVMSAVITIPVYSNNKQRQAIKNAGYIAGLNIYRIISEPTAAALAYGCDMDIGQHKLLVCDFGGGTSDVSILQSGDGVFEVLSTRGDDKSGGDDFDNRIIDYLIEEFKGMHSIDLRKDNVAFNRLKEGAETAKIELSVINKTNINIPYIAKRANNYIDLNIDLTRDKFNKLTVDIIKRIEEIIIQATRDAGLEYRDIDKIILVGESSKIPAIQDAVKRIIGKQFYKHISHDEYVALGSAIQAGVLAGEVKNILLLDVTPFSLGIETLGGIMTIMIERNTTIPTKRSQIFTTTADSQTSIVVSVFQGERQMAVYNTYLGELKLTGIAPAPRGIPQIEVTFSIDANGIINVSAKDLGTGKEIRATMNVESEKSTDDKRKVKKKSWWEW